MSSTTRHTIYRGENRRLTRNLKAADGTPLAVASLAGALVQLIQGGEIARTLTLGTDAEVYAGGDGYSLILELTSAITSALKPAALGERWILRVNDAAFVAEPDVAIHVLDLTAVQIR